MIEVAVGLVLAWVLAKARRAAVRADGVVDAALDSAVDRVGELVLGRLGSDTAVRRMRDEAAEGGDVSELTRQRVELALRDAVEQDAEFAQRLTAAVAVAKSVDGWQAVIGSVGVVISGGVRAQGSGVAFGAVTGGSVSVDRSATDPREPGRA